MDAIIKLEDIIVKEWEKAKIEFDVVDQEKNRINAPTMIAVKDGKLSGFHIDTVSSHIINEQGILPPLSEEQKNELHKVIKDLLDKVK